jgi:hypothetical protein
MAKRVFERRVMYGIVVIRSKTEAPRASSVLETISKGGERETAAREERVAKAGRQNEKKKKTLAAPRSFFQR